MQQAKEAATSRPASVFVASLLTLFKCVVNHSGFSDANVVLHVEYDLKTQNEKKRKLICNGFIFFKKRQIK